MICPPIPVTAAEVRREAFLWRLAGAFQALMDEARNPCALKGGTALRFQTGLSRPSTDLDFEGDRPVSVRKALVKAMAAAAPDGPYRIGRDFLWRGTIAMTVHDAQAGDVRSAVDYRKTGSRPGMPAKIPLERCERVRGINIYTPSELVNRKLHTIVGARPRQLARDIYDTAWIVSERPDLLRQADAAKLGEWIENVTPRRREQLQDRLQEEELTARVSAKDIWEALETGIRRLEQRPDEPGDQDKSRSRRATMGLGEEMSIPTRAAVPATIAGSARSRSGDAAEHDTQSRAR